MSPYTTLTIRRQAAIAKLNLIDAEAAVTVWDDASNEEMGDVLGRFLKESSLFNFIVVDDSWPIASDLPRVNDDETTLDSLYYHGARTPPESGTTVAALIAMLQALPNQQARIDAVIRSSTEGTWSGDVIERQRWRG